MRKPKLTAIEMCPSEFEEQATYHGWEPSTIRLLLRPPLMREPFQMGTWLVRLVKQDS